MRHVIRTPMISSSNGCIMGCIMHCFRDLYPVACSHILFFVLHSELSSSLDLSERGIDPSHAYSRQGT